MFNAFIMASRLDTFERSCSALLNIISALIPVQIVSYNITNADNEKGYIIMEGPLGRGEGTRILLAKMVYYRHEALE